LHWIDKIPKKNIFQSIFQKVNYIQIIRQLIGHVYSLVPNAVTDHRLARVEFVLAPQHETPCNSEITTKEDFDYWRKITEESNLEV